MHHLYISCLLSILLYPPYRRTEVLPSRSPSRSSTSSPSSLDLASLQPYILIIMHPHCCTHVQRLLTLLPVPSPLSLTILLLPQPISSSPLQVETPIPILSKADLLLFPSPQHQSQSPPSNWLSLPHITSQSSLPLRTWRDILAPHTTSRFSCADHAWHGELLQLSLVTGQGKICSLKGQGRRRREYPKYDYSA
jgi:hypothetical protein